MLSLYFSLSAVVPCDQLDNCNATIHGSCTWSTLHGCRPVDVTSPFLTIVEESQFYDQITSLITTGQNCIGGQSQASCEAAGCLWAPRTPEEIYNAGLFPFSHEPCQPYSSALVDLLAVPFSLTGTGNTATNVQIWHQRANRCKARSVSNCMQISDLAWTARSTSAEFPCVVSDSNDVEFCDLSMEGLLWALGADAVQDNTVLQSAMEGRVYCAAINEFLDSDRCPVSHTIIEFFVLPRMVVDKTLNLNLNLILANCHSSLWSKLAIRCIWLIRQTAYRSCYCRRFTIRINLWQFWLRA